MRPRIQSNAAETAALPPEELKLFYRRHLHRLIEIAETTAEMALAQAQRDAADGVQDPTSDPMTIIERAARCIRRTIMLDRMLDQPPPVRRASPANSNRIGVIHDVDDDSPKPDHVEWPERLDRPDFNIELSKHTVGEVIRDIEGDLGLERPLEPETMTVDVEALYDRLSKAAPNARRQPRSSDEKSSPSGMGDGSGDGRTEGWAEGSPHPSG